MHSIVIILQELDDLECLTFILREFTVITFSRAGQKSAWGCGDPVHAQAEYVLWNLPHAAIALLPCYIQHQAAWRFEIPIG